MYGEIPALRWNVPPLNESCMRITCGRHKAKDGRYKVSGEESEERTGAADKAMFQLVEVQPCQLLVSDT